MPELPEVETIRRELAPRISGQRIRTCRVLRPDIVSYPTPDKFCRGLKNDIVREVTRKAKYLIIVLVSGKQLIFHLRLSGTIVVRPRGTKPERFTRIALSLDNHELFFNEPRVLGRAYLIENNRTAGMPKGLLSLGIEPIAPGFTTQYLHDHFKKRKAPVKAVLLDQHICAGVGNIYSDEALFHAGIRPTRRAFRVTRRETGRLVRTLKNVLKKAVRKFGTSVGDYVRTDGTNGSFQDLLYVYQREGLPCRICRTEIKAMKIGNRSTRYCPKCQKS
ncbi:bifunctional DNA-formamidopyrimidine glycosylase/DNA-(apurinic or apyrimidinic site) lyase [candidate division WOR-3 bacterium]|nr:bifunctional DNA-formamidopyrimidine glycosylase/DNA-(apurinic or apyrimidinic site) lyase [candidate division WOR-3 bacterium]